MTAHEDYLISIAATANQ